MIDDSALFNFLGGGGFLSLGLCKDILHLLIQTVIATTNNSLLYWWESCTRSHVQLRVCFLEKICFIRLVLNSNKYGVFVSFFRTLDQIWSRGHFLSHNNTTFYSLGMVCAFLENYLRVNISLQNFRIYYSERNLLIAEKFFARGH